MVNGAISNRGLSNLGKKVHNSTLPTDDANPWQQRMTELVNEKKFALIYKKRSFIKYIFNYEDTYAAARGLHRLSAKWDN